MMRKFNSGDLLGSISGGAISASKMGNENKVVVDSLGEAAHLLTFMDECCPNIDPYLKEELAYVKKSGNPAPIYRICNSILHGGLAMSNEKFDEFKAWSQARGSNHIIIDNR